MATISPKSSSDRIYLCIQCDFNVENYQIFAEHLEKNHQKVINQNKRNNNIVIKNMSNNNNISNINTSLISPKEEPIVEVVEQVEEEEDNEEVEVKKEEVEVEVEEENRFVCNRDDCSYIGRNGNGLRIHLMRRHDIRVTDNRCLNTNTNNNNSITASAQYEGEEEEEGKEVKEEISEDHVIVVREETEIEKRYMCLREGCGYVGLRPFGLRVHMRRKHGIREENRKEEELSQSLNLKINNKKNNFKCFEENCVFVGKNERSLKTHQRNGHKIKTTDNTRMTSSLMTSMKNKKKKNKIINRRLDKTVISYRMRRRKRWTEKKIMTTRSDLLAIKTTGTNDTPKRKHVDNTVTAGDIVATSGVKMETQSESTRDGANNTNNSSNTTNTTKGINRCKCLFPKCGHFCESSEELRKHIQSVHKNPLIQRSITFSCYFPKCLFVANNSTSLRQHLSRWHEMAPHNQSSAVRHYHQKAPLTGSVATATVGKQKLFHCRYANCYFKGSLTLKGLRIHSKRNHKNSNNSNNNSKLKSNQIVSSNHVTTQKQTIIQSLIERNINGQRVLFKCPQPNCAFTHSNLDELRQHANNPHHILVT